MPCDDPRGPEHAGADRQVGRAARGDGRALAGRNPAPAAAVALPAPSHHAASRQHKHRRESWPGAGPTVPGASSEPGAPGERHRTRCACGRQPSRARPCSPAERVVEREVCPDPGRPPCRGPCPPGPVRSSPGKHRGAPPEGGEPCAFSQPPHSPSFVRDHREEWPSVPVPESNRFSICPIMQRSRQTGKGSHLILLCGN